MAYGIFWSLLLIIKEKLGGLVTSQQWMDDAIISLVEKCPKTVMCWHSIPTAIASVTEMAKGSFAPNYQGSEVLIN